MDEHPALNPFARRLRSGRTIAGWGPASVRGRLLILTLVLLLPAIAMGGAALNDAAVRERRAIETQLVDAARALAVGVDRQIGQDKALLAGLATSPLLFYGAYGPFDAQARAAAPAGLGIVVRAPDGQQLVNTQLPRGAPLLKMPRQTPGLTWDDEDRAIRVSNLFQGIDGQPRVLVQQKVSTATGQVVDLTTSRIAGSLGAILQAQKLSPSWTGVLIDRRGAVVARNRAGDEFAGDAPAELLARLNGSQEGVIEATAGQPRLIGYSRAPESGWTAAVSMPRAEVTRAASRALMIVGLFGVAMLLGGLLLAAWVGESVVRPIETLASYAAALGGGHFAARPRSRLREADLVGAALEESAGKLKQREEELRRLNGTLEARIAERTRELAETTESLIQAQKLEAVGRLTGGIAHDFNNLLTAIQGNLELLSRRVQDEKQATFIGRARQAADRGAKLTAQLLAFSRRQRLEPEPLDINASVMSAAQLLTSTLGGTIRVDTILDQGAPWAMADPTQLELIILNLAINARDAMPTGGLISIRTGLAEITTPSERPEAPPPGEYVSLAVSDTGTGMTPEVRARVFEPFFTTKEIGRGSGLGLPQVLGVAKQLGGGLELTTRLGEGTTVAVFFPRARTTKAVAPLALEGDGFRNLEGLCVLLVDDDPDVRGVAASMLSEMGCQVRAAASGIEALERVGEDPPPQVAVLDYAMPGLTGAQTAARLLERRPDLQILLMSGYADAAALAEAWSGPFLHKPFTASALAGHLSRLAARRNVVELRSSAG